MDLTQGSEKDKVDRSKVMMLWFGIVALLMGFAAWTSAYIVSSSRKDWIENIELPSLFYVSTGLIIISSLTYILAKRGVQQNKNQFSTILLITTMILGIAFILLQFSGFEQMLSKGNYFTGPTSNIKASYIYLIAGVHILHVVAGLISLSVVLFNHLKGKYTSQEYLGMTLGATFWHFLGILWVYLILFMTFVK
ncbi:heme-copper oxidase subunit III [Maribacter algarum]|uniref:Heme-copper oxidase subunit III n=1 Tax=Maribacter algarum (ex Zhang et al. 2020) TaxID=2578118 RepID=A0A5S3PX77_9FLAO|nr:cytochrome c oxidase subunit 3 [Maribacter algarum]TMM59551.1 heme-copper oxidase subunit III [Maribacter algarum]